MSHCVNLLVFFLFPCSFVFLSLFSINNFSATPYSPVFELWWLTWNMLLLISSIWSYMVSTHNPLLPSPFLLSALLVPQYPYYNPYTKSSRSLVYLTFLYVPLTTIRLA